ncbi:MAG: diacylglycerol kinase family protein [bacterium]|nr:diacylglycerol kinase family protein [bacterium]
MLKEVGIFVHPYAGRPAQNRAREISKTTPNSFLTSDINDIKETDGPVLVAGGDGSIRRVVECLCRDERFGPIGALGGGTNNVLRRGLVKKGLVLTLENFLSGQTKDDLKKFLFKPGLFGQTTFNITVGLGKFEKTTGTILESLRGYAPRPVKSKITSLLSVISMARANPNVPPLDLFSTSPNFGSVTLFPKQKLHSSLLTHAWIEEPGARGAGKLALSLVFWQAGIEPPSSCIKTEQGEAFEIPYDDPRIWIDGDTVFKRSLKEVHGNILVSRSAKTVALTAIV